MFVKGGNNTAQSFSITGNALTVNLGVNATGVVNSTALSLINAINANGTINGTILAANATGSTGAGNATAFANTTLAGGSSPNSGLLILNGVNNPVTLDLGNAGALGTGNVYIEGGNIDNTSGATLTLGTNNKIAIDSGVTFLGTNSLNLGTGNVDISNGSVSIVSNANSLTIGGAIIDSGNDNSVTTAGSGNIILRGASTFGGSLTIEAGQVHLSGGDNRLPTTVAVNLGDGINGSGILQLGNSTAPSNQTVTGLFVNGAGTANAVEGGNANISTLTVDSASPETYSGFLGLGNGVTTAVAANELALTVSGGTFGLSGNNTYLGVTKITGGGDLQIGVDNNLGYNDSTAATGVTIGDGSSNGGTLEIVNPTVNPTYSLTSNRTITLLGTNTGIAVDGGVTFTLGANSTVTGAGDFNVNGGSNGNGTLVLGSTNSNISFTGALNVNGGTLDLTATDQISLPNIQVSVASGALLDLQQTTEQTIGSLSGAGNVAVEDATLTIGNNSVATTFSGNISGNSDATVNLLGNGTLTLSGNNSFNGTTNAENTNALTINSSLALANSAVILDADNAVRFGSAASTATIGNLSGNGNLSLTKIGGGAVALSIGGNNLSADYVGGMSGLGSVTKVGTGSQEFDGYGNYSGSTTVSAGQLILTGTNTYGGGTSIASGATLTLGNGTSDGVDGSITGAVVDSTGGTFEINAANPQTISNAISGGGGALVDGAPAGFAGASIYKTVGTSQNITGEENTFGNGTNNYITPTGGIVSITTSESYTGNTTVVDNVLNVVGSSTSISSANVQLENGSSIGGNGTVIGNVQLTGGSGFAPGNAQNITFAPITTNISQPYHNLEVGTTPGFDTLTINGTVSLDPTSGGSSNLFHLSSNSTQGAGVSDKVVINGTMVNGGGALATGTIVFDFEDTGYLATGQSKDTYTLITETSGNLATQFSLSQFQATDVWDGGFGTAHSYFMFAAGGTQLQFVVVPEPAMWSLLAGGAMLLIGLRRKRKLASVAKSAANIQA